MKKLAIIMTLAVAFSTVGATAFADEAVSLQSEAGIKPDSILYPIDTAIDNLKVTLASSDEDKAEVLSEIAEERLGESEAMTEEGKTDLATEALEEYNENMTEAVDILNDAIENSEDTADKSDLDDLAEIEKEIIDKQKTSIEVLKLVENKVSENAKETIAKVIEMQTAKHEAMLTISEKREQLNSIKSELEDLKAQLEIAKQAGDTDAIATLEEQIKLQQETLLIAKEEVKQALEEKKAVNKEVNVGKSKQEQSKEVKPEQVKKEDNQTEAKTKDTTKKVEEKSKENSKPTGKQNNSVEVKNQNSKPTENQGQSKADQPKDQKDKNK